VSVSEPILTSSPPSSHVSYPSSPAPTSQSLDPHVDSFNFYCSRLPRVPSDTKSYIPPSSTPTITTIDPCTNESSQTMRYVIRDLSSIEIPNGYKQDFVVGTSYEPNTYREAVVSPEWQMAMSKELAVLEGTGTWIWYLCRITHSLSPRSKRLKLSQMVQ
jgi:hypothetical protein